MSTKTQSRTASDCAGKETRAVVDEKKALQLASTRNCGAEMEFSNSYGDPVSYATDSVTREWFVELPNGNNGKTKYHVTVADYTSVNPDSPRIIIGVNGVRWSVEVHYGFSAYPLCGPPCTYTWQMDGNTFELALDAISLHTWRGGLLLFVNGREAKTQHSKQFFWFKRFMVRAVIGILWIAAGLAIHYAANRLAKGDENLHHILIVMLFLGLSLITMVMVLPCAIGLSYLVVGCLGVFKFGLANVMGHSDDQHSPSHSTARKAELKKAKAQREKSRHCYVILEEESPYAVTEIKV